MNIATEIKEKRTALGLTQEQLAEKIFVSSKTISNWETGKTTPDIDNLIRLKNILNLSLDNLLLEGSDLVENIKKYAILKKYRTYNILAYISMVCFAILNARIQSKLVNFICLGIGIIATGTLMISLSTDVEGIRKSLTKNEKSKDRKQRVLFLFFEFILLIIVLFSAIHLIFFS